MGKILTYEVSP